MSIGETLAHARQEAGLTTAEVAETTRIRRTLVEAIEADDYRLCGGDVYARGHIGTLARTVGLDPAPLLAEFDAEHVDTAPTATRVFEAETGSAAERSRPNWAAAMAVALVLVVGIGVWQLASRPTTPREIMTGVVPSVSATPTPSTEPTSSATPEPSNSDIAEVPDEGVTVVITAVGGQSWISANEGNRQVFQGLLEEGQSETFSDDLKVSLVVGNAGAVTLTVNGNDLGSPGGNGDVSRLTFTPEDLTASG